MGFILSSDSCCDKFKSYLKQNKVYYAPMAYIIDDVEYRDNFDSDEEYRNFYSLLREGKMPKTTQLNAFETAEHFEKIISQEKGDIIHLSLSGGLSNTVVNAQTAAEEVMQKYPDRKIYVIDTKGATQGMAFLLDRAIEQRNEGKSAKEVVEYLTGLVDRIHHWIFVKDLFHLKRGGRVSPAAAVVGSLLGIRPVLVINHRGELAVVDKVKGVTKTLEYAVKTAKKYHKEGTRPIAYIANADDIETCKDLEQMLVKEGFEVQIGYIGPVIGTHTGPGTVGLVFEADKRIVAESHK